MCRRIWRCGGQQIADLNIQLVVIFLKKDIKLNTQEPALCQHTAALLDEVAKIPAQLRIRKHHSFSKQRTDLCTAYVEHIAQAGNVCHSQIISTGSEAVAQAGAVHKQIELMLSAHPGDFCQFRFGVDGAQFGRIGDIHHFRQHHVLLTARITLRQNHFRYLLGSNFSIR
jgi:hypothetical protein